MGAIAGSMADNDRIGYIADYPIYGNIANINAFAMGAQMVNPRAVVYLEWSRRMQPVSESFFAEKGITIISGKNLAGAGHVRPAVRSLPPGRRFHLEYGHAGVELGTLL